MNQIKFKQSSLMVLHPCGCSKVLPTGLHMFSLKVCSKKTDKFVDVRRQSANWAFSIPKPKRIEVSLQTCLVPVVHSGKGALHGSTSLEVTSRETSIPSRAAHDRQTPHVETREGRPKKHAPPSRKWNMHKDLPRIRMNIFRRPNRLFFTSMIISGSVEFFQTWLDTCNHELSTRCRT